jgi:hypothetical protein
LNEDTITEAAAFYDFMRIDDYFSFTSRTYGYSISFAREVVLATTGFYLRGLATY